MRLRTLLALFALLVMTLTACSAASVAPSPSVAASVATTPVPTATPVSTPRPTPIPCPPHVCDGALPAGDYTSTSLGATITFTLGGDGWSGGRDIGGLGFALFSDKVNGFAAISVAPFSGEVFSQPCSDDQGEKQVVGGTPADLIAFLKATQGIQSGDEVDTTVGGQPAIQLDLTVTSPCPDSVNGMLLWTMPRNGNFHLTDGEQVRVLAVDAAGKTIVIVAEAFPDADYDALLQKLDEVLGTMTITP